LLRDEEVLDPVQFVKEPMRHSPSLLPAGHALILTAVTVVALFAVGRAHAQPSPAAPLAWTDVQGHRYGPEDLTAHPATVFLFWSSQCPVANRYVPRMIGLARDYRPKGVMFFLVDSNVEDSRAVVVQAAKDRALPFPAVKDHGTALADRLGAQATPEAIVLDGTGAIRYLGRIDDNADPDRVTRRDLRATLDALLAGQPIARTRTLPFGCAIFRDQQPARDALAARSVITYARDVAPILNGNCVVCHRRGEVAPFSLETYQQARVWARQIKQYTARRLMPPWKATPGFGDFRDARFLTDRQIATLARWAESGASPGNLKQLPPAPHFPPPAAWPLGTPDQVLQAPRPYHLAAEGKDVYRNFVLPIDFKEDRYVAAWDFKPDNRAVVHHIVTYIDPTGQSAAMDGREEEPGYTVPNAIGVGIPGAQWGDVWVPGSSARRLPPGMAVRIPAGAKLVMQVHYHKTGKVEIDRSRMALYFAKGPVEKRLQTWTVGNMFFELPAGQAHQEVHADLTLPVDVHMWSIFPHMHMLGHEMKVTATLPNGTVKPLVWIKDWDFNWQATYLYREPLALPRGTKLRLVAVYDNSERNPRQTAHPPRLVRFGEQTTDEMCFAFFGVTVDGENLSAPKTASAVRPFSSIGLQSSRHPSTRSSISVKALSLCMGPLSSKLACRLW
jgi:thiol-disulfide isomerase/thioredoxin